MSGVARMWNSTVSVPDHCLFIYIVRAMTCIAVRVQMQLLNEYVNVLNIFWVSTSNPAVGAFKQCTSGMKMPIKLLAFYLSLMLNYYPFVFSDLSIAKYKRGKSVLHLGISTL